MKKKSILKLLALGTLLLSSCSVSDFFFGPSIESISIINKQSQIFVDEQIKLNVDLNPSNTKDKELVWKSHNKTVASIDENGLLTGLKVGEAQIEVFSKVNYSITDKFNVKVIEPALKSISIKDQPENLSYYEGQMFDPTGLVIETKYDSDITKTVEYVGNETDFAFYPTLNTPLSLSNDTVEITYKEKTVSIIIEVSETPPLTKTKLQYTYDDYMNNNLYGLDNCPLVGNPKLLIIPIWFNDSDNFITDSSKKDTVRADIEKAYTGTTSQTGWHSVKSFYETESFGKINLTATVADWYEVNSSYTKYAPESALTYTTDLVSTASDAYFTSHPSDSRKNYDSNSDGYLDGVMLIYAAPDNSQCGGDSNKNLWAYCYWTSLSKNLANPKPKAFFWASYDFMYGSNAYAKAGTSYGRGYTEHGITIDTHCFTHEMGHVFGLNDYYDYSQQYSPAGGFSMQDSNVGGHDPYSVMAYGWADPYIPTTSMTISIGDFQSTHDVILLANHSVTVSPFDEYLLLEYYTPTGLNKFDSDYSYLDGYPKGPTVGGIRLWHVDARLFSQTPRTSNITTIPSNYVYHVMSNSYSDNAGSPFGSSYYNYNLLQLIRNDVDATYKPVDELSASKLFRTGDEFNMSTFASQFVNAGKLNDKTTLGWSFRVDSIEENKATITLTRA